LIGCRKQPLKNRRRRGQHEECRPNRSGQCHEQPQNGITLNRSGSSVDPERQSRQRQDEQDGIHDTLPLGTQPRAGAVGVRVARQKQHLEEDDAGVPDHWRAAENRQHHFRDHGLDHEHQERAEEKRRREQRNDERPRLPFDARLDYPGFPCERAWIHGVRSKLGVQGRYRAAARSCTQNRRAATVDCNESVSRLHVGRRYQRFSGTRSSSW
jgi:hypothetical protein